MYSVLCMIIYCTRNPCVNESLISMGCIHGACAAASSHLPSRSLRTRYGNVRVRTLLGMKYHSVASQGHVAVMLGPGKAAMLLQSTANSGPGGRDPTHPGVHDNVSLEDCFRTEEYCKFEYAVLPQHWIGRKQPPSCQDKMFGECGAGVTPGFNVTCCPGAQCKPAQKGAPPVCVPGTEPQLVQTTTPTPTPAPDPLPVRVACVGDSITAGYLSSNASFAYPGRLQAQLDSKYGPGKYTVTNFGAGGATVQRSADSPYWNRTQFAAFVNGSNYDIVIIMLGTNDAKDKGNGGAPNWPAACRCVHLPLHLW
jgi:hypothetical protein